MRPTLWSHGIMLFAWALLCGCGKTAEKPAVVDPVHTDVATVQKIFPNLTGIEAVSWHYVVGKPDESALPSPDSPPIAGFIRLSAEQSESIKHAWTWVDSATPPDYTAPSAATGGTATRFQKSAEFSRGMRAKSWFGDLYLLSLGEDTLFFRVYRP